MEANLQVFSPRFLWWGHVLQFPCLGSYCHKAIHFLAAVTTHVLIMTYTIKRHCAVLIVVKSEFILKMEHLLPSKEQVEHKLFCMVVNISYSSLEQVLHVMWNKRHSSETGYSISKMPNDCKGEEQEWAFLFLRSLNKKMAY